MHSKIRRFVLCFVVAAPSIANADVIIVISESGNNVVASLSGELNLDATLSSGGSGSFSVFWPANGYISVGAGTGDLYSIDTTAPVYGPGTFGTWDSSSGDFFGFRLFEQASLYVPQGYVSESPLSGSSTKLGTDIATLGFTPGEYTSTITGSGGVSDNITVRVSAVPEPSSFAMLAVCSGLCALRRRRITKR